MTAVACLTGRAAGAFASPLDAIACLGLDTEVTGLNAAGTRLDMQKGPEWAKANLSADKLARIQRLIETEEQIAFRCRVLQRVVAPVPRLDDETPVAGEGRAAVTVPDGTQPAAPHRKRLRAATAATGDATDGGGDTATKPHARSRHAARKDAAVALPPPESTAGAPSPLAAPAGN